MSKHGNKHDKKKGFRGQFLQHPGFLTKPVGKHEFKRELKSMRKLEFGPQERQLRSEQRASNLQQQRIGDWFNQYQQQVGRLNANVTGTYDQAVQGAQQDTAATSAYAEKLRQRVGAQAQDSATLRGAAPSTAPDQQAVQANLARRQTSDASTNLLRSQGAAEHSYFVDKKRIGKGEEISQLLAEAARGRQVNQDLRDLNVQKQDFADKFINELRPQERDFYLGLLQAQLGNKQAKLSAQTSRSNAKLSANQSNINSKRTARSSAASRRQSRHEFNRTHTPGGKSRGTVSSGGSGGGKGGKGDIHRAIQHMVAELRSNPKQAAHRSAALDHLVQMSTTYNRSEAKRAYAIWKKKQGGNNKPGVGPGPGHTHR